MTLDLSSVATAILSNLGSETYVTAIDYEYDIDPVTSIKTTSSTVRTLLNAAVLTVTDTKKADSLIKTSGGSSKRIVFDNAYTPSMDTIYEFGGVKYRTIEIDGAKHAGTQQFWSVICQK